MYETQIAAGIDYLERDGIDWRSILRGKPLDMGRGTRTFHGGCVFAHIYGGFSEHLKKIGKDGQWAVAHGFAINPTDLPNFPHLNAWEKHAAMVGAYEKLTAEWVAVIQAGTVPDHVPADTPTVNRNNYRPLPTLVLTGIWRR